MSSNNIPDTLAAGHIAKFSVNSTPISCLMSISSHIVVFSRWSGCEGYAGAGLIPWYFTANTSSTDKFSSFATLFASE